MSHKPLSEQVVVIMGASSGIGRATALRFAEEGAAVVVSARNEEGLATLVKEIEAKGGQALSVPAEVTDSEQVEAVAQAAVERFGHLDTWVHSAAVSVFALVEETTPEEFRRVLDVNFIGQVHGIQTALPHLRRAGGGSLILLSSAEGIRALPYQAAYSASKHAIIALADALRVELAREGTLISVTTIMPSTINTPFYAKARTKLGVKPRGAPPMYEPMLVADAILQAAVEPVRHRFVGGAGRMLALTQALSPELVDVLFTRFGFSLQRTGEPKAVTAPDNLYEPVQGHAQVRGEFDDLTLPFSVYDALQPRPALKAALGLGTTTVASLIGALLIRRK